MIELAVLTLLITVVVIIIKPGRTPPLENPLVIERGGQFRATLAPKLNLAQPLLESISKNLSVEARASGDSKIFFFSVLDGEVKAHGVDHYLFAVALHAGMLHFKVAAPRKLDYDYNTILKDSAATFAALDLKIEAVSPEAEEALLQAVQTSATQFGIKITLLTA